MTTEDFINKLNAKIALIEKEDKPLELSVRSIMAIQSNRIFIQGKNSDGNIIGTYSRNGVYIPKDARLKPTEPLHGKNGDTTFKNGKERKTGYFSSYFAYKREVGRSNKINTVDLFLTGDLHRDWANAEIDQPAQATKINQHNYLVAISEENHGKVERYGRVFNLSVFERSEFLRIIKLELIKALA